MKHYNIPAIALFISLTSIFNPIFPQLQFVRYDTIPVEISGETISLPWAGGFNSPQFSSIDLNGDGLKDLVAFERDWFGAVKTFINKGAPGEVDYEYDPSYQIFFPVMHNWALFVDYNCDGKEDIFTSVPAGLAVYRNDFSEKGGLHFTLVTSLLFSETPNGQEHIYVSPPDMPAITDIDGDGDIDILSFGILGQRAKYFKNRSMENNGNCDDLDFVLESECWGYFSESDQDNTITLFDTCGVKSNLPKKETRHAGSSLLAIDFSGDGAKNLMLGDISNSNMTMLTNGGTAQEASMTAVDTAFPSNSLPVDLTAFPAGYYLDVNNDNKKDMLVSPNNPNTSENFDHILFYKNKGSEDIPVLEFQQKGFLQDEMIDVGAGAKPSFFDYNGDGLQDIVIGNYGYFEETNVYAGQLSLFENTGTSYLPAYKLITRDAWGLSQFGLNALSPAFGDLDNDGKMEMLVGDENGNVHLFMNNANPGNPAEFVLETGIYKSIDVGQFATPQIMDVNRDGMPDLLIGERSGTVNYYENMGTVSGPDFNSAPTNDFFGEVDVMPECCTGFSSPTIVEDSTGSYVMYVGSEQGYLYRYDDIDDNLDGAFILADSLYLYGFDIHISGADINNDGKIEIVYGEYAGGIALLKNGKPQVAAINTISGNSFVFIIYPNPANNFIKISMKSNFTPKQTHVEILDIYGSIVVVKDFSAKQDDFYLNISHLAKGVYIVKVNSDGFVVNKKIIVQR
ncbi:MAG: T9SS type A sorting domain-containing protein [Chlorobi bacterium]|nr:T9SS type A sorting domain-containing protein [Chlorobiota bacterium]